MLMVDDLAIHKDSPYTSIVGAGSSIVNCMYSDVCEVPQVTSSYSDTLCTFYRIEPLSAINPVGQLAVARSQLYFQGTAIPAYTLLE
jgi:hypothetical protein